jgi:hypothetical protein
MKIKVYVVVIYQDSWKNHHHESALYAITAQSEKEAVKIASEHFEENYLLEPKYLHIQGAQVDLVEAIGLPLEDQEPIIVLDAKLS